MLNKFYVLFSFQNINTYLIKVINKTVTETQNNKIGMFIFHLYQMMNEKCTI